MFRPPSQTSSWSNCTALCSDDATANDSANVTVTLPQGYRSRTVSCVSTAASSVGPGLVMAPGLCSGLPQPSPVVTCAGMPCPSVFWQASAQWTACSQSCMSQPAGGSTTGSPAGDPAVGNGTTTGTNASAEGTQWGIATSATAQCRVKYADGTVHDFASSVCESAGLVRR